MSKSKYGTSGGVELTDALIERLAEEAEKGYDVKRLRPRRRRGRPPIGSEAATLFQVRLEPELREALGRAAHEKQTSPSDLTRQALRAFIEGQLSAGLSYRSSMESRPGAEDDFARLPGWLYTRPSGAMEPPVVTQLLSLDFAKIRWEDFERLALEVATVVDGLRSPRLYGKRGQRQDAIDFYGDWDSGRACYQARRLDADPTPGLLASAVQDFKSRGEKFAARRFVLCIARSGRSSPVQDALRQLKAENPTLEIELYDSELLSEVLKRRRDMVHRYFGPAWADAFCGQLPQPPPIAKQPADRIDALLRGPLASLGLEHRIRDAEGAPDTAEAARIYGELAAKVEAEFPTLVPQLRLREADARRRAGDPQAAAKVWLNLAIRLVDSSPIVAELAASRLRDHVAELPAVDRPAQLALEAKINWYRGDASAVDTIGRQLDELLAAGSEWAPCVALWLGELALVDGSLHRIGERAANISQLASQVRIADEDLNVRLELLVAEQSGDWTSLISLAATGRLSSSNCGLIFARHGRWLVDRARPDQAVDSFLQAITPLARSKWLGDAAEAIYSIIDVLWEFGPADQVDAYRERVDLVRGQPKRFTADRDYQAAALESVKERQFGEAQMLLRRMLWQATIAGHTTDEIIARRLLGDLYSQVGEHGAALGNYVLAGRADQAAEAIRSIGGYVQVPLFDEPVRPSRLGAQLAALEAEGDLIPEADARALFLRLQPLLGGIRQGPAGPRVLDLSMNVLGAVALQLSDVQIAQLMEMVAPLIPRAPNTYSRFDAAILQILSVTWHRHRSLRARAAQVLPQVLCQSSIGQQAVGLLAKLLQEDTHVAQAVVESADHGCLEATLALALAGVDHPSVTADAIRRFRAIVATPPRQAGESTIGIGANFELMAPFVKWLKPRQRTQLANYFTAFAEVRHEPEINRASAISAVGLMANHLAKSVRQELFNRVLVLAKQNALPSDFDSLALESQHLLSMFRFNLPARVLPQSALPAAARLCLSRDRARDLQPVLLQLLTSQNPADVRSALTAYTVLPPRLRPRLDVRPWAEHPNAEIRVATVGVWLQDPLRTPDLAERFATDADRRVRVQLASSLHTLKQRTAHVADVVQAHLESDVSAEVRTLVSIFQ